MKNWANKIKQNFAYRSKSDLTDECNIDLNAITEQLAIKEKAELAAENGLPVQNAVNPDSTEREIQSYFENRMAGINRLVARAEALRV